MNQHLWDQGILDNLNSEIPETAPYLARAGYVQNNILRMQEILRAEESLPDWMDALAIEPRDLMDRPGAWEIVQFLYGKQTPVAGVWEIPRFAEQRFYEGWIAFTFPQFFTGRAYLTEHYDDERECYVIDMEVRHSLLGLLFGYRGEFTCEFPSIDAVSAPVPVSLKPYREERRE